MAPSLRYSHLFKKTLLQQQQRLLDKFDREVRDTMEKIKTNRKLKIKRKKTALLETTRTLLKDLNKTDNFLTLQSNVYSSGSPEQLVVRNNGMSPSFLTTRMRILNTNFLRAVAEIFATDEKFCQKMTQYKFRITEVRVSMDFQHLKVYWTTEDQNSQKIISSYLNTNKGRLHELLIETQYVKNIPWITFVYDLQASYEYELQTRFEKCRKDIETSKNDQEAININSKNFELKDYINFSGNIDFEFENSQESLEKLKYRTDANEYSKLEMPQDMFMKNFNLNYESLYNKVLQNMHRTRTQHLEDISNLNLLESSGSKKSEYSANSQSNPVIDYNTERRIKEIKKFVQLNRRRKDRIEKKIKRAILCKEINRFNDYKQIREFIEKKYSKTYEEQIQSLDENYLEDDELNM